MQRVENENFTHHKSHHSNLLHSILAFHLSSYNLNKEEAVSLQCVWTCQDFYSILLCFRVQVGCPPPSPGHPSSSFRTCVWGRPGSVMHAWAHSFMSDTELSHCEQSVFASMLTNELSPVSSEKSFQKGICSRKSDLILSHFIGEEMGFRILRKQAF